MAENHPPLSESAINVDDKVEVDKNTKEPEESDKAELSLSSKSLLINKKCSYVVRTSYEGMDLTNLHLLQANISY